MHDFSHEKLIWTFVEANTTQVKGTGREDRKKTRKLDTEIEQQTILGSVRQNLTITREKC